VIEPERDDHNFLAQRNIRHLELSLTQANYREILGDLFAEGQGFCVNLSVDTSSLDVMKLCRELGVLYIDTVVEPWAGFYFDRAADPPTAPTTPCARPCATRRRAAPAAPPPFPAAAPTPAWSPGS
jgi:homospermidine synthase